METLAELISLVSDILLVFLGIYIIVVVTRVYSLYQSLGFSRTSMTPFLLVGAVFAFFGVTRHLEVFVEVGRIVHSLTMLLAAVFLLFGLRNCHKMLMKAEESRRLSKKSSKA